MAVFDFVAIQNRSLFLRAPNELVFTDCYSSTSIFYDAAKTFLHVLRCSNYMIYYILNHSHCNFYFIQRPKLIENHKYIIIWIKHISSPIPAQHQKLTITTSTETNVGPKSVINNRNYTHSGTEYSDHTRNFGQNEKLSSPCLRRRLDSNRLLARGDRWMAHSSRDDVDFVTGILGTCKCVNTVVQYTRYRVGVFNSSGY